MAFRWLFLLLLFVPQVVAAAYAIPLTGTTTTGTIYAFPASVNGTQPALMSPWFLATSTSRASLFPFASTTAVSAVSLCLTGDICRQTWPTATTPAGTAGQLQYNASGSFGGISTTTLTISGFPAQIPSGYGKLVGGADTTFTWWGIATSSNLGAGQLVMSNGGQNVSSVATTSITCSGNITCTGFTGLGAASAISFTGTLPVSSGGTNSTSFSANSIIVSDKAGTTLSATSSDPLWVSSIIATSTTNKSGIATSSPWGMFSINPVQQLGSAPSFVIGSSSGQVLNIDNTGALNLFTNNATSTFNDKYGTTLMSLFTGSTTGPAFTVIATTSTPSLPVNLFSIDQYGHLMASSTPNTPTVSCSPSGGTLAANSNDTTGSITTGTLSVSCALTFSRAYSQTPLVFVTQSGTASIFGVSSRSTTAFTVTLGTAATSDVLQYFVIMP